VPVTKQPKEITMKNLTRYVFLPMAATSLLLLSACANMSEGEKNTAIGAGIGAVTGSVLSGGSPIGTVGGAVVGGAIGNEIKKK
jgi:osmotically inducible lipoprotein OsmB